MRKKTNYARSKVSKTANLFKMNSLVVYLKKQGAIYFYTVPKMDLAVGAFAEPVSYLWLT